MIDAAAVPSAGVVAGSMRGFGGPQAFYAIECLVDEAAGALGLDAIELRQRNRAADRRPDRDRRAPDP